jgi:hypothetical protein
MAPAETSLDGMLPGMVSAILLLPLLLFVSVSTVWPLPAPVLVLLFASL